MSFSSSGGAYPAAVATENTSIATTQMIKHLIAFCTVTLSVSDRNSQSSSDEESSCLLASTTAWYALASLIFFLESSVLFLYDLSLYEVGEFRFGSFLPAIPLQSFGLCARHRPLHLPPVSVAHQCQSLPFHFRTSFGSFGLELSLNQSGLSWNGFFGDALGDLSVPFFALLGDFPVFELIDQLAHLRL